MLEMIIIVLAMTGVYFIGTLILKGIFKLVNGLLNMAFLGVIIWIAYNVVQIAI